MSFVGIRSPRVEPYFSEACSEGRADVRAHSGKTSKNIIPKGYAPHPITFVLNKIGNKLGCQFAHLPRSKSASNRGNEDNLSNESIPAAEALSQLSDDNCANLSRVPELIEAPQSNVDEPQHANQSSEIERDLPTAVGTPAIEPFAASMFDLNSMFEEKTAPLRATFESEVASYRRKRNDLQEQLEALQRQVGTLQQNLKVLDKEHEAKRSRLSNKMTKAAEALRREAEQAMQRQWAAIVASLPK